MVVVPAPNSEEIEAQEIYIKCVFANGFHEQIWVDMLRWQWYLVYYEINTMVFGIKINLKLCLLVTEGQQCLNYKVQL